METVELAELITALSQPAAFPSAVAEVVVHQTHISAVFLGGDTAYKIKKPVDLGFLDFSTLEKRRHFCEQEVLLNRRLAPHVYLGVVPVAFAPAGLQFEGEGPVVEWAVKMVRMSPDRDLEHRIERGEIDGTVLHSLAERIAHFHRQSPTNETIARQARWDVVADNAIANLDAARSQIDLTLSQAVFDRLSRLTREELDTLKSAIERRAANGVPRDTHGDLRVDHVYWLPERPAAEQWCILDCIEFNEQFRYADPVADVAFLVMDLAFHGRWDLAQQFARAYFQASRDKEGADLLPLYASYRAAVRAKVDGILLQEAEIPAAERNAALQRAKAHWLAALAWLAPTRSRPCVVLVGGLPGSGKTTLARALTGRAEFTLLRSDVVRKELAGHAETESLGAAFGTGHYSDAWNDRTYRELERRAEEILWLAGPVLVDASFREDARRVQFLHLARRWGVPVFFLHCDVPPSVAKARLQQRRGDASDADGAIYDAAAQRWEVCSPDVARVTHALRTDGPIDALASEAWRVIDVGVE